MIFSVQINLLISESLLFHSKLKNCELFHKNTESHNASIIINMNTSSKYVRKKKNAAYVQHLIMMIRYVASKMYQQDTNASTAIRIIQYESQNTTRKKNI